MTSEIKQRLAEVKTRFFEKRFAMRKFKVDGDLTFARGALNKVIVTTAIHHKELDFEGSARKYINDIVSKALKSMDAVGGGE